MVSRALLLVASLGIFISQNVNAAVYDPALPYEPSSYRQLLSQAPWYSYCDPAWMSLYDAGYYGRFSQIADTYDIRTSDVYQYHTLIDNMMPSLPDPQEDAILQSASAELRKELNRRGIPYLPTAPSCTYSAADRYPYAANPAVPAAVPAVPVLAKRSPVIDPDYPLPATGYPSNYPYTAGAYPYNSAAAAHPYTAAAADAVNSAYDYATSFDYSLAYRNLYSMVDQYMPSLPRSAYQNIKNTILNNTPAQYAHLADDLANQLTTNIRYDVGMAQATMPSSYSYYYY